MHALKKSCIAVVSGILGGLVYSAVAAPRLTLPPSDLGHVYKAIGLKVRDGKLINSCDEAVHPEIDAIDINADGKSEAFVRVSGPCYGAAGAEVSLLIRDSKGEWQLSFSFPAGGYKLLATRKLGYPDIEITGPGLCFPVWRWTDLKYDIYKSCNR